MDKFKNSEYRRQAINLLHNQLYNCFWNVDDNTKLIDKEKLINMFNESCRIIQKNEDNQKSLLADAVFESCVRAVRCLCIKDKDASKLLLQDKVYTLDALSQYENAIRNYELIKE